MSEAFSVTNDKTFLDDSERPPKPPQPKLYLKFHGGSPSGAIGASVDEDEDQNKIFWEPISYKKLMKLISTLHPVDPMTKQRFSFKDRITIKDYRAKLSDACFCYAIGQKIIQFKRWLAHKLKGPKLKKFEKPESMQDLPSSNSSCSDEDDNTISECSQALGDGAALYLQMMYTFIIMFFILTLINLPIYIIYESNTNGNDILGLS